MAAPKKPFIPTAKDDGSRWVVVDDTGKQVYPGPGVMKAEATRLATGLVATSKIKCVKEAENG